jgi:TolB protein
MAAVSALPAFAQFRVEVTGVGLTQLPIAMPAFRGEGCAPEDFRHHPGRPGAQRPVPRRGCLGRALDETSRPDVALWRQKGADSLATGSITRLADGRWDVRFRLWDVVKGQDLGGQGLPSPPAICAWWPTALPTTSMKSSRARKAFSPPASPM